MVEATHLSKGAERLLRYARKSGAMPDDAISRAGLVKEFERYPNEIESSIAELIALGLLTRRADGELSLTEAGDEAALDLV